MSIGDVVGASLIVKQTAHRSPEFVHVNVGAVSDAPATLYQIDKVPGDVASSAFTQPDPVVSDTVPPLAHCIAMTNKSFVACEDKLGVCVAALAPAW
jgi:hypothetical protein